jgi:translation elongation factor EF-G
MTTLKEESNSVLLEPVVDIEVSSPNDYSKIIINDIIS